MFKSFSFLLFATAALGIAFAANSLTILPQTVALTGPERAAIGANVWLDDALHAALVAWVEKNYRDRILPEDLADPALLFEGRRALDELSALLGLGSVYRFQRSG